MIPANADAQLSAVGDQIQAMLDASGLDVVGFAVLIDVGDGYGVESRSRIPANHFAGIMLRRYSREIRTDDDV